MAAAAAKEEGRRFLPQRRAEPHAPGRRRLLLAAGRGSARGPGAAARAGPSRCPAAVRGRWAAVPPRSALPAESRAALQQTRSPSAESREHALGMPGATGTLVPARSWSPEWGPGEAAAGAARRVPAPAAPGHLWLLLVTAQRRGCRAGLRSHEPLAEALRDSWVRWKWSVCMNLVRLSIRWVRISLLLVCTPPTFLLFLPLSNSSSCSKLKTTTEKHPASCGAVTPLD